MDARSLVSRHRSARFNLKPFSMVKMRNTTKACAMFLAASLTPLHAQTAFTWQQIKERFRGCESDAEGGAAQYRRIARRGDHGLSSPQSGFQFVGGRDAARAVTRASGVRLAASMNFTGISYLHEREHKRELRLDSAKRTRR